MSQWYAAVDGRTSGPHSWDELVALGATGGIGADDLVWEAGDASSLPARAVRGLLPVTDLPAPRADDLVAESVAWHVAGRGDPQAPAMRVLNKMGTLRLADGRLSFTTPRGTVRFDAPVSELHSPAPAEGGAALELWEGATRHRMLFAGSSELGMPSAPAFGGVVGLAETASGVSTALAHHKGAKATVSGWLELLEPRVATAAPEDVRVRGPRTGVLYWLLFSWKLLFLLAVMAVAFVVAILVMGAS
ncbi:MAG TPA: DUF4339 domain-containing protein [Acidimicrobiales bacterium]|nr:DUF4339 domain-containing protein [Acidimicrobiales bacterium]